MKKSSSIICLIILLTVVSETVFGQWKIVDSSANIKPLWVSEAPEGAVFRYYSGMGSSNISLQQAQENAIGNILQQLVEEGTFNVRIESITEVSETIQTTSEGSSFNFTDDFLREITRTGTSKNIKGLQKEEEYWQSFKASKGLEYQYWVLFKIPKPGANSDVIVEHTYGFEPVWKSVLIPGWGQRYKGEKSKGSRFLIATATAGIASFFSFYLSESYNQKAENERDTDNRIFYNSWSNRSHTMGVISGIIAGGIYGYNIFDAMTAPGAKKYAQDLPNMDRNLLAYYDGQSAQLAIKLYF